MKKILYTILILLSIILMTLVYARFIGIIGLKTNEIPYKSSTLAASYNGLKIVHFSDIHYKKAISNEKIEHLITEINKIKPDIILFTGDLIDTSCELTNKDNKFLIKELSKLNSKYGNYAVLGDNDYLKEDTIKSIYIQSNFTLLENSSTIIYNEENNKIFIGGLSSSTYEEADINKVMSYFANNNESMFKILLTHEPDYIETVLNNYSDINLILAGHSINGSINIPLIKKLFLPPEAKKYYKPYYHKNNTDIYISNGIGLNNFNFRLFNHPSLNFYRIKTIS